MFDEGCFYKGKYRGCEAVWYYAGNGYWTGVHVNPYIKYPSPNQGVACYAFGLSGTDRDFLEKFIEIERKID